MKRIGLVLFPLPFSPGAVTRLRFALNDIFHTFRWGHRIMIQVQSTWFPMIDRNAAFLYSAADPGVRKSVGW